MIFLVYMTRIPSFSGINGEGKTTTLSILSGEFPPTSGEAFIDGFSIRDDQTNIRRRIGYCPQFDALLELLTVREHLELYGRIKGFRGAGLEAIVRGKLVSIFFVFLRVLQLMHYTRGFCMFGAGVFCCLIVTATLHPLF